MPNDALRRFIAEARLACGRPHHCPSIVHALMTHVAEFDDDTTDHLIAIGLNKEVREFLKQYKDDDDTQLSTKQLEMWPSHMRDIVAAIERASVYVPSEGDFIPLVPSEITKEQVREAGQYLISHGEADIRRGTLLIQLSDLYAAPRRRRGKK